MSLEAPILGSRFKFLGKIIIPFRKIGTRLFVKWYVDRFIGTQKYLDRVIWEHLNSVKDIIVKQSNLIVSLYTMNLDLLEEVDSLKGQNYKTEQCLQEYLKELCNVKDQLKLLKEENLVNNQQMLAEVNSKLENLEHDNKNMRDIFNKVKENFECKLDFDYFSFSKKFGGSTETIKKIYSQYIPSFINCKRVLDLGCGTGQFLELLTENGIKAEGVDSDPNMVSICKAKGLTATTSDILEYLENIEPNSFDGMFMGHVIEHFSNEKKIKLLKKCFDKLCQGGILIIETPNISSDYVMRNLYYLDPTHEKPLHFEALQHICNEIGFITINSYLSYPIKETNNLEFHNYSLILLKKVE